MWGCARRGDKQGAEGDPPPDRPHQGAQPRRVRGGVSQDQGVPSGANGVVAGDRAGQGHPCDAARTDAQG